MKRWPTHTRTKVFGARSCGRHVGLGGAGLLKYNVDELKMESLSLLTSWEGRIEGEGCAVGLTGGPPDRLQKG